MKFRKTTGLLVAFSFIALAVSLAACSNPLASNEEEKGTSPHGKGTFTISIASNDVNANTSRAVYPPSDADIANLKFIVTFTPLEGGKAQAFSATGKSEFKGNIETGHYKVTMDIFTVSNNKIYARGVAEYNPVEIKADENFIHVFAYNAANAWPPVVSEQPQGAVYHVGDTADEIRVAVDSPLDGGTIKYQWYSNTEDSNSEGTLIQGATSAGCTPSTETGGTTYYYVMITNDKGGSPASTSIPSRAVRVYVGENAEPPITPIHSVSIEIDAPVKNEVPAQTATAADAVHFTSGQITWEPAHEVFQGGIVYTATVTLTAESGHTFTGLEVASVNGQAADVSSNTGTNVTLSYTFSATDTRAVSSISIKYSPTNLIYNHGEALNLDGLIVTLNFDSGESEDVPAAEFSDSPITTIPNDGDFLSAKDNNGKPIKVKYGNQLEAETENLTVNKIDPVFDDFNISETGLFLYDQGPKTVTVTAKEDKTTGIITVKYNGNASAPSNVGTYTVTIDVAADQNYNAVFGLNVGTLTIKATVNIDAIGGVTAPVYGAIPVTTITANGQYSGNVTWSPPVTGTFTVGTVYTATITLEVKDGYTLQGVSVNFFTVAGTSTHATNAANSNVITAVFPPAPINVYDSDTWDKARTAINSGGSGKTYTINVIDDFSMGGITSATFTVANINVTIIGDKTITLTGTGSLLYIGANQTVVIRDTDFKGNSGNNTSLVYLNGDNASLTMEGNSSVSDNTNTNNDSSGGSYGGGVYVNGTGATFTMKDDAAVSDNTAKVNDAAYGTNYGGGGVYVAVGTFTMEDSARVSGNIATGNYVAGGGVYVTADSSFTMRNDATVSGNNKTTDYYGYGGGVYVKGGSFIMQDDASVSYNTTTGSDSNGAGVYVGDGGNFIMGDRSAVSYNTGSNSKGAGVAVSGDGSNFIMEGNAAVDNNNNSSSGGGVYGEKGSFTMRDYAMVFKNTCSSGSGAGVYIAYDTDIVMEGNAKIFDNIASNRGGGVDLLYRSSFIMRGNAEIYGNEAKGTSSWGGGGVSIYGGGTGREINFTMEDNAQIHHNSSVCGGGGVQLYTYGINFTMKDYASVHHNTSYGNPTNLGDGGGGGVQVYNGGTFIMKNNASVSDNISGRKGGGVDNGGTFTMEDDASVSGNSANGALNNSYGTSTSDLAGGVYHRNTSTFTMTGNASVSGNTVINGTYNVAGGVYVNTGTFVMKGNASVSGNSASFTNTTGPSGGGVTVKNDSTAIFRIEGGTIYGSNADPSSLANTCIFKGSGTASGYNAALYKGSSGIAQRGTFNPSTGLWGNSYNLTSTDNTIKIANGALVP